MEIPERTQAAAAKPPRWAAWAVAPVLLAASLVAFLVLRAEPFTLFAVFAGGALLVVVGWVLTSVLWPARADRGCPRCGVDALVRLDPESTVGIRCTACGHRDASESSWLLAEEEGPLEDVVLAQRGRRRARRPVPGGPEVDSLRPGGYD